MRKSIDIKIKGKCIEVEFNKELQNQIIILNFEIVNPYQIICTSITIENNKYIQLSSTDIRKLNTHTLIKRGLNAIYSYRKIDKMEFDKDTNGKLSDKLNYKALIKTINSRKLKDRDLLLSIYSYIYQYESTNYDENVSKRLSNLLNYSEGYIKNLTKEAFKKDFIQKNIKGVSGGILSEKTISLLSSL